MAVMFQDVNSLWLDEGFPAFCVSPGDIVDTGAEVNYRLAKNDLGAQLGKVAFYPGIGNHEYHPEDKEDGIHTAEEFSKCWGRPVRYTWMAGDVTCIMLEQPFPYKDGERREDPHVVFSREALTFLDAALDERPESPAIIFAHCPLRDTVLCGEFRRGEGYSGSSQQREALYQRAYTLGLGFSTTCFYRRVG